MSWKKRWRSSSRRCSANVIRSRRGKRPSTRWSTEWTTPFPTTFDFRISWINWNDLASFFPRTQRESTRKRGILKKKFWPNGRPPPCVNRPSSVCLRWWNFFFLLSFRNTVHSSAEYKLFSSSIFFFVTYGGKKIPHFQIIWMELVEFRSVLQMSPFLPAAAAPPIDFIKTFPLCVWWSFFWLVFCFSSRIFFKLSDSLTWGGNDSRIRSDHFFCTCRFFVPCFFPFLLLHNYDLTFF